MARSDHQAIRDYLMRESQGTGNSGKKMVLNPQTGKFEVAGRLIGAQMLRTLQQKICAPSGGCPEVNNGPNHVVAHQVVIDRILQGDMTSAKLAYADDGEVATIGDEPGSDLDVIYLDDELPHCPNVARGSIRPQPLSQS